MKETKKIKNATKRRESSLFFSPVGSECICQVNGHIKHAVAGSLLNTSRVTTRISIPKQRRVDVWNGGVASKHCRQREQKLNDIIWTLYCCLCSQLPISSLFRSGIYPALPVDITQPWPSFCLHAQFLLARTHTTFFQQYFSLFILPCSFILSPTHHVVQSARPELR